MKMFGMSKEELNDYIIKTSVKLLQNRRKFKGMDGKKRFDARIKALHSLRTEVDTFFK